MSDNEIKVVIERLEGLKRLIEAQFAVNEKQHNELIAHQKETNGNVRKNTNYRYYMTGVVAVLAVIFSIAIREVLARGL